MPRPTPALTIESARDLIRGRSFPVRTGGRVGVELEWFTAPSDGPASVPALERILAPIRLPWGSTITFEPGAQVELSSAPFAGVDEACHAVAADGDVVRRRLADHGIQTFASGSDPLRSLRLATDAPRYVAMRAYLDAYGPAAGHMMCASAAVHVNLDAGRDAEGRERWAAARTVGPAMIAAFANSPFIAGARTGWKSSRWRAWTTLDPSRTSPVLGDGDPAEAWADYALDARVMFVRGPATYVPAPEDMRFSDWIASGHELGHPDDGDLLYHLTTLFPPVRPRGWLELRMIDMLPEPWWRAAVAVATAVVCDREARDRALEASRPAEGMWEEAARCGLEDPALRAAARGCFEAALPALRRMGCGTVTTSAVEGYVERYVAAGRCPADELLDGEAAAISPRPCHYPGG